MQRLTYINARGQEIEFTNYAPYVFWKIKGLELPPVSVTSTQAVGQHGYTLDDILLESRLIQLTGHIHGRGEGGVELMYELRRKLTEVCNPLLGLGSLIYENNSGAYRIEAFCKSNPPNFKQLNLSTLDIAWECPNPFFKPKKPIVTQLAYIKSGIQFPLKAPNVWGALGYQITINNDGDAPAPLEFMIDGGAINPKIINETTGKFIQIERQLQTYDKMYINTDPENTTVEHITIDYETNEQVRTNAYGYLTPESELFSLALGKNLIRFASDDGNKRVKIGITYSTLYTGV